MNTGKRKKKRLRNLICFVYCSLQLMIVLLAFHGAGKLLDFLGKEKSVPVQSAGIIIENETDDSKEEEAAFSVCLDAGHGGKDVGSDYHNRLEKDDNLKITQAVADYLSGQNVKIVLTRADDTFYKLSERCNIANQNKVDYFVSLHRNKGDGNGVETWIGSGASEQTVTLAENIMAKLEEAGISRNRGVKKGTQASSDKDYYINSNSDMPACIVELGFMNNSTDNSLFDEKLQDYAKAIGDAILMTYEQYAQNASGTGEGLSSENPGTGDGVQQTEAPSSEEPQEAWEPIENVESLSSSTIDWGQGTNVDENNRPVGAVSAQETYGSYQAYFIKEDTDKKIYLTFDEGYEYGFSDSILNTLKEKEVKAVFFVTEPYAKEQPELVRRMIDEGHTVGNHSVTHPSSGLPSQSLDQQKNEVEENHQYVKDNFGYEMNLFRFPAGKFSEQSLAIVHNCGYKSVFWSFAYLDYDVNNQPDQTESLNKMIDKLHPGAIYLLHAESETNAAVLGEFIDRARAAGYEFELFR